MTRGTTVATLAFMAGAATADDSTAERAMGAFSDNCFSPFMTAARASKLFASNDVRVDFYDLDPFSKADVSKATGRVTPGTDRRCEVAFEGDHAGVAADVAVAALTREGILTEAALQSTHSGARTSGTALLAARQLNPRRIAVVHVGTRPGPNGIETFMNVERLRPQK